MNYTFNFVNNQFIEMRQQQESDMAALTDSQVQVGQFENNLAFDVTSQMQHLTTMVQSIMAHFGSPQQPPRLGQPQPQLFQPISPLTVGASVFDFGTRQLRRSGTGSRSPRREGDDVNHAITVQHGYNSTHLGNDGIPDLPSTFTFDTA